MSEFENEVLQEVMDDFTLTVAYRLALMRQMEVELRHTTEISSELQQGVDSASDLVLEAFRRVCIVAKWLPPKHEHLVRDIAIRLQQLPPSEYSKLMLGEWSMPYEPDDDSEDV